MLPLPPLVLSPLTLLVTTATNSRHGLHCLHMLRLPLPVTTCHGKHCHVITAATSHHSHDSVITANAKPLPLQSCHHCPYMSQLPRPVTTSSSPQHVVTAKSPLSPYHHSPPFATPLNVCSCHNSHHYQCHHCHHNHSMTPLSPQPLHDTTVTLSTALASTLPCLGAMTW